MKKVLFIDDCPDEQFWLKRCIGDRLKVTASLTLVAALNMKPDFDFVVIDYSVISEYGFNSYNIIRDQFPCPIILTSNSFPFLKAGQDHRKFVGKENLIGHLESLA